MTTPYRATVSFALSCTRRCGTPLVLSRKIASRATAAYTDSSLSGAQDPASSSTPPGLDHNQRNVLDRAIRVDQAGEIAANWIYKGQMVVLGKDPHVGPIIQDMWDQEKRHLIVMDKLQAQHHVQPTLLSGVAKVAGFGLGAVTAIMGKEAAMACTEAVETVIGEHYDDQLVALETLPQSHPSIPLLARVIRELRDDELEHLDTAVQHHSQRAPAHALLSAVVGGGCKIAIRLCKEI